MKTISPAAYEAGVAAAGEASWRDTRSMVAAIVAALGFTVRDGDPAPPAVVRISRQRYEAGVRALKEKFIFYDSTTVAMLDCALSVLGIDVEPERPPEERLAEERLVEAEARIAELEAQRAAFVMDARGLTELLPEDPPVTLDEALGVITRHFPEVRRDGR